MKKRPSLRKVLWNDYVASICWLLPLGIWLVCLVLLLTQAPGIQGFALLGVATTLAALAALAVRWYLISSVLDDGMEVRATISGVFFWRDRGRIQYVYSIPSGTTVDAGKFEASNAVHRTAQTRSLQVGAEVTIVVDRERPKRAYIRDLYL